MNKEIATPVDQNLKKEIAETLGYTQELQLQPTKDNTNIKSLLLKLLIISVLIGAACALIFGIGIAKAVI